MLVKTRGIALHTIKYGDSGIVVHVYTEKFGRQAYLVKGAYGKKTVVKANLFYPLNLLELEVYRKDNGALQKLKDAANIPPYTAMPFDAVKNCMAIFIAEVLYKVLREEAAHEALFNFLFHSLQILDLEHEQAANFHLLFLVQLTKFLGFFPTQNHSEHNVWFDLLNGQFVALPPAHGHYIDKDVTHLFSRLLQQRFQQTIDVTVTKPQRNYLIEKLLEYYAIHNTGIGQIKSFAVLKEIFK